MSAEKKHWRLPTPFQSLSGRQASQPKPKVGHSRSRVTSVYLSEDTSTSGFIVVPEFDDTSRMQAAREESNHASHLQRSNDVDSFLYGLEPTGVNYSTYIGRDCCSTSVPSTSWDDDLSQRLTSAYEHIRSMSSALSPNISFSSDPQMLRKQLGVPEHSVLNYAIHSSPDLPNPYILPQESASSLPPTSSLDMSHARASKRFGSCKNMSIYPLSPRPGSPDLFQPMQREAVATVPTPTESSPSQWHTLEVPLNVHITCMPKPRPSLLRTSKLTRRHNKKPITSLSSPPSARRQVPKAVLRKPVPDTQSSTNTHTWQNSLPQVRPPSPFKVDMPLHHPWHDRRSNLSFPPEYHSRMTQSHDTNSRRTSGNTEALASLAWIGSPLKRPSCYTTDRTYQLANSTSWPDGFSLAIAVEDDSISDDALVNRLEEVRRRICGTPERGRDQSSLVSPGLSSVGEDGNGPPQTSRLSSLPPVSIQLASVPLPSPATMQDTTSDKEDAKVWQAARKALLCIREIIRTEKRYQEAIKMLLNAQTATPPPPSMVPYISALVQVSETLLKCFLEDPSAWGVSTAFVTSEDELEATMVSWCNVAGVLFVDGNDLRSSGLMGRWRQRKSGVISSPFPSITKQSSLSLSPLLPSVFSITSTAGKRKERMDEEYGAWQHPQTEKDGQTTFNSSPEPENRNSESLTGPPPSRKLSIRDLAIQPIQRVVRYVLLYRDLLECTPPTSPPRLLVERALEAAMRIADHCDSAQRNPAFFRAS